MASHFHYKCPVELPHLLIDMDTSGLSFSDSKFTVIDQGTIETPVTKKYPNGSLEYAAFITQYSGVTSVAPASLGPAIPRRFRLHGVQGAKYLPFTVRVKSRNVVGYGDEIMIDAKAPDPPEVLDGNVVNDRQINLKIRGPKNNYGAMVTKYLVRWTSKRRMGKQIQG